MAGKGCTLVNINRSSKGKGQGAGFTLFKINLKKNPYTDSAFIR